MPAGDVGWARAAPTGGDLATALTAPRPKRAPMAVGCRGATVWGPQGPAGPGRQTRLEAAGALVLPSMRMRPEPPLPSRGDARVARILPGRSHADG